MKPRIPTLDLDAALNHLDIKKEWFESASQLDKTAIDAYIDKAKDKKGDSLLEQKPVLSNKTYATLTSEEEKMLEQSANVIKKAIELKLATHTASPPAASSSFRQALRKMPPPTAELVVEVDPQAAQPPKAAHSSHAATSQMIRLLDKNDLTKVITMHQQLIKSTPSYTNMPVEQKASFDAAYAPKTEMRDGRRVTVLKFETIEQMQAFVAQLKQQGIKFEYVAKPTPEASPAAPSADTATPTSPPTATRRSP